MLNHSTEAILGLTGAFVYLDDVQNGVPIPYKGCTTVNISDWSLRGLVQLSLFAGILGDVLAWAGKPIGPWVDSHGTTNAPKWDAVASILKLMTVLMGSPGNSSIPASNPFGQWSGAFGPAKASTSPVKIPPTLLSSLSSASAVSLATATEAAAIPIAVTSKAPGSATPSPAVVKPPVDSPQAVSPTSASPAAPIPTGPRPVGPGVRLRSSSASVQNGRGPLTKVNVVDSSSPKFWERIVF
jgi:hypothetical protein